jgi:hypothetical protein
VSGTGFVSLQRVSVTALRRRALIVSSLVPERIIAWPVDVADGSNAAELVKPDGAVCPLLIVKGQHQTSHRPVGRRRLRTSGLTRATLQVTHGRSMQLTARQGEFVRIAGWVLPVSITLGAVFGHFQAQNGSLWGYVQGAVTAIVISCTILLLEFAVFSRTRSALARRMPFLLYLMLRSLGYLAVILMGLR